MSNYKDLSSEELKRTLAEKQDILRRTMKPDEYKKFMQELDDCQIKIDYSKFGKPVQYPETKKEKRQRKKEEQRRKEKAEREAVKKREEERKKEAIKRERAKMSASLRYDVMKRDNFRCTICGRSADDGVTLHVDHIKPVSKGGKTEMSNLRTLCDYCNLGKSDKYDPSGMN